uniref:ribosomal protein L13 n=1 Tax=Pachymeniopsis lanceolata TaxID=151733 RepID=UPI002A7EB4E7|nr:ribosomal protein L13 [Pachymeniopsis lanceolata]WOL37250.1 ribosomal protein L13 [Pachymeniopsis lanceolata]
MNKTYIPTKQSNTNTQWYLIDAKNQTLGRLSANIAKILRGKNETTYTPYLENNTYVIIKNAKLIQVTGKKRHQKIYRRHSGRPGGLKSETFFELQKRIPNRIIEKSVKGMLPKGPLGRKLFTRLRVYSGDRHPHEAQQPQQIYLV